MCVTLYVQLYVPTPPNPPRGRSDYLEPVATSVLLSLSVSIALLFIWGVWKSDCKTIHFYFPALHWLGEWQSPKMRPL